MSFSLFTFTVILASVSGEKISFLKDKTLTEPKKYSQERSLIRSKWKIIEIGKKNIHMSTGFKRLFSHFSKWACVYAWCTHVYARIFVNFFLDVQLSHELQNLVFSVKLKFRKHPSQRLSSMKGCLPSKFALHNRLSFIKGYLPSNVIFHQRGSSIKGRLPLKVVFN